jgi:ABC-type bacteriocin/lantibiotic exporter with double-glycine peptidase domain
MNNVHSTSAVDVADRFVNGAIERLAASVSSKAITAPSAAAGAHAPAALALGIVLDHFGCALDDMSLANAARHKDVEAFVRAVCETKRIHVRRIELAPRDARPFAGPVLAFRANEPVVLLPSFWRKRREAGDAARNKIDFDPHAYSFYRTLPNGPLKLLDLWRTVLAKENRHDLIFAMAWGAIGAGLSTVSITLMRALVEWALPLGDRGSLMLLALGWCVVAFTAANLRLSRALLQARIGTRIGVNVEAALVDRALALPLSALKGIGAGDISERIHNATDFGRVAVGTASNAILAVASVAIYGAMLATTSGRAAGVVVVLIAARSLLGGVLLAVTFRSGRSQAIARGKMSALLFEMLTGISRIKVASAEPRAFHRWATAFARVRSAGYRTSVFSGLLTASEGLFDVAGTIVLYGACCGLWGGPTLSVGSFVVATASLVGLQAAYGDLVDGMAQLLPLVPNAERVTPLLKATPEVQANATVATLEGNVSLRDVTFHYADDDIRVLDNVSMDIQRGEFVAIVGPSGCGKSTLIKLILGFYAPTSGSVLLDGKDLASLDLRSVRRQIGAVLQGSELLPSSIRFNIVGTTNKTLEDAWIAARRACIADDIEQMPMKMFTVLSDRSVTISGGQKQRILIARALVREPKLVIFDEATSALDNKTQAGVMAALRELSCTKICIAHRLSTVVRADRILVMDKGRIVQEGTFDSLMQQEGLFRTLARAQLNAADEKPVDV